MRVKLQLAMRLAACIVISMSLILFPSGGVVFASHALQESAYADDAAPAEDPAGEGDGTGTGAGGEGGTGTGDTGNDPAPVDPDPGTGGEEPVYVPKIQDISIYTPDSNDCYGSYTGPNQVTYVIREKGGRVDFEDLIQWDDWSENWNAGYTTWSVSDPNVATITQGGVLTAVADGTVEVYAEIQGDYSVTGQNIWATCTVRIEGQDDQKYLTDLRITDADGNEFAGGTCIITQDLSVAMEQFYVNAYVYDPATGQTTTYCTRNGMLSQQVPGLSDVNWYMSDSAMGTVDPDLGLYRPARYGIMILNVSSNAGRGNSALYDSVTISMRDPNGGMVQEDYHPQETLRILGYYELYPPADLSNIEAEEFVINKEFELGDLMALGTETHTYTALGGGSYFTMTGTGPTLASVLGAAGVNLNGVATVNFGTADSLNRPVSYNYIVGTNRYYYPNVDIGSYSEAQQVYPILAIESNEVRNASTAPDYNMTESTRYRLLFGSSGPDDASSQYQIKWINTLYIVLAGGPEVKPGKGGGEGGAGDGNQGTGSGSGQGEQGQGDGNASGNGDGGNGTDNLGDGSGNNNSGRNTGDAEKGQQDNAGEGGIVAGGNSGNDSNSGNDAGSQASQEGSTANQDGESEESQASADTGASERSGADEGSAGNFSVYQVLNNNDSITQTTIDYENPFKPLVAPVGCGILLLGVAHSVRWYLLQTRTTLSV